MAVVTKRRPQAARRVPGVPRARWPRLLSRRLAGVRAEVWCVLLLLVMGANMLSVVARKSLTNDEVVHIPAAYAYLTRGNFRLNNEHPPLAKEWAALPLLIVGATAPASGPAKSPVRRTLDYGQHFWAVNAAHYDALVFWARVPMILLTLLLGGLIFWHTRDLFGARAALCAVALFSIEPTMLAHGRVVHTDVPAALGYFATFIALSGYLRRPGWRRALILGLVVGAAFATKFSLLLLAPVLGVMMVVLLWLAPRRDLRRWAVAGHAGLVTLLAVVVINATYGFHNVPLDDSDVSWIRAEAGRHADLVMRGFHYLSAIVPTDFLYGLFILFRHNQDSQPGALLGMQSSTGFWYYFPVAFALKTTLPFLMLTVAALGWAVWRCWRGRDWRFAALLAPVAIYAAFAMSSNINIGIRHFLPVFPFLFVLGGAALDHLLHARQGRRGVAAIVVVLLTLGWGGVEAVRAYPDQMSYLNELAWQHPRWWYLSDSNVEWGDNVRDLASYLHAHDQTAVRAALSGGWDTLQYYGVEYVDLFGPPATMPHTSYVAIGASFLNGSTVPGGGSNSGRTNETSQRNYFAAYRGRTPVAVFGQSIYLYQSPDVPPASAPLPPDAYRAQLRMLQGATTTLSPGQVVEVTVRVRNISAVPWPQRGQTNDRYQVRLGDRWFDASGVSLVRDDARAPLLDTLAPNDFMDLPLTIRAPATPGKYSLEIDLVQEGVAWFSARGSIPLRLAVLVR